MTHEEMSIATDGKWIPPKDNLRDVLTRYLLTYGITHKQAATEIRRDLKAILSEIS